MKEQTVTMKYICDGCGKEAPADQAYYWVHIDVSETVAGSSQLNVRTSRSDREDPIDAFHETPKGQRLDFCTPGCGKVFLERFLKRAADLKRIAQEMADGN